MDKATRNIIIALLLSVAEMIFFINSREYLRMRLLLLNILLSILYDTLKKRRLREEISRRYPHLTPKCTILQGRSILRYAIEFDGEILDKSLKRQLLEPYVIYVIYAILFIVLGTKRF